jgi:hypothetical protein
MVVLGRGALSYEPGTPVVQRFAVTRKKAAAILQIS